MNVQPSVSLAHRSEEHTLTEEEEIEALVVPLPPLRRQLVVIQHDTSCHCTLVPVTCVEDGDTNGVVDTIVLDDMDADAGSSQASLLHSPHTHRLQLTVNNPFSDNNNNISTLVHATPLHEDIHDDEAFPILAHAQAITSSTTTAWPVKPRKNGRVGVPYHPRRSWARPALLRPRVGDASSPYRFVAVRREITTFLAVTGSAVLAVLVFVTFHASADYAIRTSTDTSPWQPFGDEILDRSHPYPPSSFGHAVALAVDNNNKVDNNFVLAVGAPWDGMGSVHVYEYHEHVTDNNPSPPPTLSQSLPSTWKSSHLNTSFLTSSSSSSYMPARCHGRGLGDSLAMDANGNLLAVADPGNGVYLFTRQQQHDAWEPLLPALLDPVASATTRSDNTSSTVAMEETTRSCTSSWATTMALSGNGRVVAISVPQAPQPCQDDDYCTSNEIYLYHRDDHDIWQPLGQGPVRPLSSASLPGWDTHLSLSYDGRILAVGSGPGGINTSPQVHVYTYDSHVNTWQQQEPGDLQLVGLSASRLRALHLSGDGRLLVVGRDDPSMILFFVYHANNDVWIQREVFYNYGYDRLMALTLSLDGSTAVARLCRAGTCRVNVYTKDLANDGWHENGHIDDPIFHKSEGGEYSLALSADGTRLAAGSPHSQRVRTFVLVAP